MEIWVSAAPEGVHRADVPRPTVPHILQRAATIIEANAQVYGNPQETFRLIAELWTTLGFTQQGCPIVPRDVALAMIAVKLAREAFGQSKLDNWIDIAGYAALGGEDFGDD